jgi:hypothetical protein
LKRHRNFAKLSQKSFLTVPHWNRFIFRILWKFFAQSAFFYAIDFMMSSLARHRSYAESTPVHFLLCITVLGASSRVFSPSEQIGISQDASRVSLRLNGGNDEPFPMDSADSSRFPSTERGEELQSKHARQGFPDHARNRWTWSIRYSPFDWWRLTA